jgi:hypothetical protein
MREVCFCGWAGVIEDRAPVYAGDSEWGLACPTCGHLDRLDWLNETERRRTLDQALRRQLAQRPSHWSAQRPRRPARSEHAWTTRAV